MWSFPLESCLRRVLVIEEGTLHRGKIWIFPQLTILQTMAHYLVIITWHIFPLFNLIIFEQSSKKHSLFSPLELPWHHWTLTRTSHKLNILTSLFWPVAQNLFMKKVVKPYSDITLCVKVKDHRHLLGCTVRTTLECYFFVILSTKTPKILPKKEQEALSCAFPWSLVGIIIV